MARPLVILYQHSKYNCCKILHLPLHSNFDIIHFIITIRYGYRNCNKLKFLQLPQNSGSWEMLERLIVIHFEFRINLVSFKSQKSYTYSYQANLARHLVTHSN